MNESYETLRKEKQTLQSQIKKIDNEIDEMLASLPDELMEQLAHLQSFDHRECSD